MPDGPIAASRGIQDPPREGIEKIYLDRMSGKYGPDVHPDQIDLNFSHWLAFHDWGALLKESPWATDRDLERKFWSWFVNSRERMAQFVNSTLGPFVLRADHMTPGISFERILPKEEIKNLVLMFPPYQDVMAISILRELLGKEILPDPVEGGPRVPKDS